MFMDEKSFFHHDKLNLFYETDCFRGWYYGTLKSIWDERNIFIMTPKGVEKIKPEDRKNCFIIYLDIDRRLRWERLNNRQDIDDVHRRLQADDKDFKDFKDYDMRITNPDF